MAKLAPKVGDTVFMMTEKRGKVAIYSAPVEDVDVRAGEFGVGGWVWTSGDHEVFAPNERRFRLDNWERRGLRTMRAAYAAGAEAMAEEAEDRRAQVDRFERASATARERAATLQAAVDRGRPVEPDEGEITGAGRGEDGL